MNLWKIATIVLAGACGLEAWKLYQADIDEAHWIGMFNECGHRLGAACIPLRFCPDPRCQAPAGACDDSGQPTE